MSAVLTDPAGSGWRDLAPVRVRRSRALAAALLAVGCGGGGGTDLPIAGEATELVKGGGDAQVWYLDNPLPAPYRVIARDVNGQPVAGVSVTWAVTSGAGSVDPPSSVTGSDGAASATHSLGPSAASQSVSASATGLTAVEFTATATSPPTSAAVTVASSTFVPRDVVVQVNGTVTWTWNPAGIAHNIIYTSGPTPRPPDSPTQSAGTHAQTFAAAARYQYTCTIHAGMEGTVTVVR